MNTKGHNTKSQVTVYEAVARAISDVKLLGKSETNEHQKYNFVSIDKFLTLVNPICAQNGLFPIVTNTSNEYYTGSSGKGAGSMWCRYEFSITLYHSSGESLPAVKIVVPVAISGAQSSGSAQSYALKQYFRSLFMIPTGDKDDPDFSKTFDQDAVISEKQIKTLRKLLEDTESDEAKFLALFEADSIEEFPLKSHAVALEKLKQKKRMKQAAAATEATQELENSDA
jgi:hypothetical protein